MKNYIKLAALLTIALAFVTVPFRSATAEDEKEYSFKVHNTTKETIKKLLVSEDGKDYGHFDLGNEGIAPDETATLKWDKSTNEKGCKWFFKAVFEGGDESKPVKFDFCEEDLELEFQKQQIADERSIKLPGSKNQGLTADS
jgi:hypothetical protein